MMSALSSGVVNLGLQEEATAAQNNIYRFTSSQAGNVLLNDTLKTFYL